MMGEETKALRAPRRWRLGSRAALLAGFGALLVVMATICVDSLLTMRKFETRNVQIRQDFLNRERTLELVRAGLYESGIIIEAYAGSSAETKRTFEAQLDSIQKDTTAQLRASIDSLTSDSKPPFQRLDAELAKYWATIWSIVTRDRPSQAHESSPAEQSDLKSQHAEILALTKDISAVNEGDLKEADRRTTEASLQFRRRLLLVSAIGLSFGSILAAATVLYAGRLERNIEEKYQESLRAQIELKQLSKRLVDAEERERRAISRELHDEVGQSLSALLLDIRKLTETSPDKAAFREGLENIKTLAENCLNEVRDMALLLRPSMLDDLGLVPALEWQAREVSKRTGMLVDTVEENVSDDLPDELRTCVYRIVQEALNNCSKHAYAKKVRVRVRQDSSHLRVSIEDDGKGFDSRRGRGMGLIGMNERVMQLGGALRVDSNPAQGTRLEVDLPLSGSAANSGGTSS
jgi:signal transduction histidine kinase